MGLEMVGIVCGIEETFGISIADDDTKTVETVGDLHELVLRKIEAREADVCLSSMAFYRLRKGLTEVFSISRKTVIPETRLDHVMPPTRRRGRWEALAKSMDLALPALEHPPWLRWAIRMVTVALLLVPAAIPSMREHWYVTALWLVSAVVFCWAAYAATRPLARWVPSGPLTVGAMAKQLVKLDYPKLAEVRSKHNPKEVLEILKGIIAEEIDMDADKITRGATLAGDLDIG